MRCATVPSEARNARAISGVDRPPSRRSVSATRASRDNTGWHVMKIRRSTSSRTSSTCAARSGRSSCWKLSSSRPISSRLRSSVTRRRSSSMPRRLAVTISHAPGLSGMPDAGHCSSAATSASWARSSATATSRTMRVSPAINRADSIRHTASIARWVADGLTSLMLGGALAQPLVGLAQLRRQPLAEVARLEDLAQLDLDTAAERRPLEPLDRLIARRALPDPIARDDLLGLCERTVDDGPLAAVEADLRTPGGRVQALAGQHHARLDELFVVLRHLPQDLRAGHLARLGLGATGNQNHETHWYLLVVDEVVTTRTSNEIRRN